MKYLHTINELNSMKKENKYKLIHNLCSVVTFNVSYKSGLFSNKEKNVELKVWFTPKQIHMISDISSDKFFDKIPEIGFKVGDKIKVALDWANDNGFEIISMKRRRHN